MKGQKNYFFTPKLGYNVQLDMVKDAVKMVQHTDNPKLAES